ncbi:MAG: hypothetical protein Q8P25_01830 [Candidatus Curtissbacteria bacterium]|nr:hypothetical protein [Candidatus Curtissbacteria bacterium]
MEELKLLKEEIEKIKARNNRVEADKAWETSVIRRIAVSICTYLVVLLFFLMIKNERPFVSAFIPALGFLLSTLSIDILKSIWLKNRE